MLSVQFYTRNDCRLCGSALAVLQRVQQQVPFQLDVVDIDSNPQLQAKYGTVIPVISSGTRELARSFVNEKELRSTLRELMQKA